METTYYSLGSKGNFNKALRHFFKVTDMVDDVESNYNIADLINEELDEEDIHLDQILPIVGAVTKDKFKYSFRSITLDASLNDFVQINEQVSTWTALDVVLVYYSTNGNPYLINPKNLDHWDKVGDIREDQLLIAYVKYLKDDDKKIEMQAIDAIQEMLSGRDIFVNKNFIDGTVAPKVVKQERKPEASVKKNLTPLYGIQVSNELFHNGNVEAWKKIVESYTVKYPETKVIIIFKNEPVNDINSLFKWGKVKHGDSIFFQLGGDEIVGVSKLKKYLSEGASPRFEQFLKIGVGQVLKLF